MKQSLNDSLNESHQKNGVVPAVLILVAIVLGIMAFTIAWLNFTRFLTTGVNKGESFSYVIEPGSTLTSVAYDLHGQGVLSHPDWFKWYGRFLADDVIRAGEYRFKGGVTPVEILTTFNKGNVIQYHVTLVEGKTFRDALLALQSEEKLEKKLAEKSVDEVRQLLGIEQQNPEGLIFPDTYQYHAGMTDMDILKTAYEKMTQVLAEEWEAREEGLPYNNAYEALIMASIVEKETAVAEEREQIAGVFVRRLEMGMRLQTDPTIIYGLGDRYQGNITRKHLKEPTAYNTYVIKGLPPTPIALPGREAIVAALHPAKGKSIFFVARGDGYHYFSETLAEHEEAVRKYQRSQRQKNYRSVPIKNK